jgi:hypothetical protein
MRELGIMISNKKNFKRSLLLGLLLFFFVNLSFAQRNDSDDYEPTKLIERIYVGAYINTPFIGGNTTGSVLSVGLQPFAGYKWNEYISTGLTIKYDFTYIWSPGFSNNLNNFSTTTFTRATIAERFIIQAEGGIFSTEQLISAFETERINFPVVYIGAGYTNRFYEILLTYELLGNLGFYQIPFEYKVGLVRHF